MSERVSERPDGATWKLSTDCRMTSAAVLSRTGGAANTADIQRWEVAPKRLPFSGKGEPQVGPNGAGPELPHQATVILNVKIQAPPILQLLEQVPPQAPQVHHRLAAIGHAGGWQW